MPTDPLQHYMRVTNHFQQLPTAGLDPWAVQVHRFRLNDSDLLSNEKTQRRLQNGDVILYVDRWGMDLRVSLNSIQS